MTLKFIWNWCSSSRVLGSREYFSNAITPRFIITQVEVPVKVRSMGQIDLLNIISISQEYLTAYNRVHIICIKNNHLKLQLFMKVYYYL